MKIYPFGERLRDLRRKRELTQEQLAVALGVTRGQIGHLETGTRGISVPDAVKLAKALGVTLDELIPVDEHGDFVEPQDMAAASQIPA